MKLTKENLLNSEPGNLGFFYSKSSVIGLRNNIENVIKVNDDTYEVQNMNDSDPTEFTLDQIVRAYPNKNINN